MKRIDLRPNILTIFNVYHHCSKCQHIYQVELLSTTIQHLFVRSRTHVRRAGSQQLLYIIADAFKTTKFTYELQLCEPKGRILECCRRQSVVCYQRGIPVINNRGRVHGQSCQPRLGVLDIAE